MSTRSFRSPDGLAWQVWDVLPSHGPATRTTPHLPAEMREGWLCFQSGDDKRRLFPVPPSWEVRTDDELWAMCRAASAVRRPSDASTDTRSLAAGMAEAG